MALFKKKLKNQRPIKEVCEADGVQNAASTLLANVRFSAVDSPLKSIVVTSSVPNEGKTTVALSLAIAASRAGSRVLLMECDMRRRSLRAIVGVKSRNGIHALLTDQCEVEDAVVATDHENLWFLDAEAGIPNPDGILSSRAFSNLIGRLRELFDYLVIDTPPITAFPDASIAASKADATILVARENYTDKREISFALQQLRAADANVLGVALNCQVSSTTGGYGYYYYGYYYEEKKVEADSAEAKEALERMERGERNVSVVPVVADAGKREREQAGDAPAADSKDGGPALGSKEGGPTASPPKKGAPAVPKPKSDER